MNAYLLDRLCHSPSWVDASLCEGELRRGIAVCNYNVCFG